jgi:hypothetical protein
MNRTGAKIGRLNCVQPPSIFQRPVFLPAIVMLPERSLVRRFCLRRATFQRRKVAKVLRGVRPPYPQGSRSEGCAAHPARKIREVWHFRLRRATFQRRKVAKVLRGVRPPYPQGSRSEGCAAHPARKIWPVCADIPGLRPSCPANQKDFSVLISAPSLPNKAAVLLCIAPPIARRRPPHPREAKSQARQN